MKARGLVLARRAYRRLRASPLRPLLDALPTGRLRSATLSWPAGAVVEVVGALERQGVQVWIGGGWGIDALLGRVTRRHDDLDLFYVDDPAPLRDACTSLGFTVEVERYARSGLVRTATVRTAEGRVIDLVTVRDARDLDPAAQARGRIDDVNVPCLSAQQQMLLNTRFVPDEKRRHDMALLCEHEGWPLPAGYERPLSAAASALVIPVPVVDDLLATRLDARLRPAAAMLPAHVTVLSPFLPEGWCDGKSGEALARLFAEVEPFPFRLARLERFADVVYLAPEPPEPFATLTRRVEERWPDFPPYNAAYDDVVPHVTVAPAPAPAAFEAALREMLPIEATASEVLLVVARDGGTWDEIGRFPLGSGITRTSPPAASGASDA